MKIAVLLSAGIHPVSGRPRPVPDEMRAIRLAAELGDVTGWHAGQSAEAVSQALGHGLRELVWLNIATACDPVAALVAALRDEPPDLILAGTQALGGEDSGMLPYLVAARLGWPIAADAALVSTSADGVVVTQALSGGARRELAMALPAVVTVGHRAPAPRPFAYAEIRRGSLIERAGLAEPLPKSEAVERAYRRRPRLVRGSPAGGDAAERLRQATEATAVGGKLLVDPTPEAAAEAVLAFLRELRLAPVKAIP